MPKKKGNETILALRKQLSLFLWILIVKGMKNNRQNFHGTWGKNCTALKGLMEDPKSRFHERDSYEYDDTGLLYHINRGNGKEYKATVVP